MANIAIYKFNSGTDTLPTFNSDYTYTYTDVDNGDGTTTRTIVSDTLPTSISFDGKEELVSLSYLDTSNVTQMYCMFRNCTKLISLDVSSFDTSNVTNMYQIFYACTNLTSIIGLENWNTSKVTSMYEMFCECSKLTELNLSNFDTSKVYEMRFMFSDCAELLTINGLANFNTSSLEDMGYMFYNCNNLISVDIGNWDISSVTSMTSLFYNCYALTELDLSGWNSPIPYDIECIIRDCTNLREVNISNWDLSEVGHMGSYESLRPFYGCENLTSIIMKNSDTDSINKVVGYLQARAEDNPGTIIINNEDDSLIDITTAEDKYWTIKNICFKPSNLRNKMVDGEKLNSFAKLLKTNIKEDLLGDKRLRYVTQAEYDALTEDQKNDENIVWNITDPDIVDVATKEYVDDAIAEHGFSGDYNDLENKPCYMVEIPDAPNGIYQVPFMTSWIPEEDWYIFPTVSHPDNTDLNIVNRDMVRISYSVPDLSLFENIEVYHDDFGWAKSGDCIVSLGDGYTLEDYKYAENVYLFNDTVVDTDTSTITKYLPCAMIVLEETIITGSDRSTTFPPGVYLHCGSDSDARMGTITGAGIKKLNEEMIPSSFAKKDEVVMKKDVVHDEIFKVSDQYDDFRNNNNPPSMSTMIQFIDYKTANSGPSIQMISQEDYDALGDNIDPGTLYIIG